jgi:hypothetical protein
VLLAEGAAEVGGKKVDALALSQRDEGDDSRVRIADPRSVVEIAVERDVSDGFGLSRFGRAIQRVGYGIGLEAQVFMRKSSEPLTPNLRILQEPNKKAQLSEAAPISGSRS